MIERIVMDFVEAINAHDVEKIIDLMADDYVFVDAYGGEQGQEEMKTGWPGYFSWFPDYHIEVSQTMVSEDTLALFGFASGTFKKENYWRIPAAWRVKVAGEKIQLWQVYADSKIPFDIMNDSDKYDVENKKRQSAFLTKDL